MPSKAWGDNQGLGILGLGGSLSGQVATPTLMAGGVDFVEVASAGRSIGRTAAGLVYQWGVRDGTTSTSTPTLVPTLSDIVQIAVGSGFGGSTKFALTSTGDLYGWGTNGSGQLGLGDLTTRNTPVLTATGVVSIHQCTTNSSIILKGGGVVQTCGFNGRGELGDGTQTQRTSWTTVTPATGTVIAAYMSGNASYLLMADGTIKAAGDTQLGEFGFISAAAQTAWVNVVGASSVVSIAPTGNGLFFARSDGSAWALGSNVDGALGVGQAYPITPFQPIMPWMASTPQQMAFPSGVAVLQWFNSTSITEAFCALGTDHLVYTWGFGGGGQMGNGLFTTMNPTPISQNGIVFATFVGGGARGMFCPGAFDVAPARGRAWSQVIA